jgi:hypothetical protein
MQTAADSKERRGLEYEKDITRIRFPKTEGTALPHDVIRVRKAGTLEGQWRQDIGQTRRRSKWSIKVLSLS